MRNEQRRKTGTFVNENSYDPSVYGQSKLVRIHCEGEDYHKSGTLAQWLLVKYDMSYKAFQNKSKNHQYELRMEFEADTGINLAEKEAAKRKIDDELDDKLLGLDLIQKKDSKSAGIGLALFSFLVRIKPKVQCGLLRTVI